MFERILLALDDSPAGEVATAFTGALAQAQAQRAEGETSATLTESREADARVKERLRQLASRRAGIRRLRPQVSLETSA